MPHLAKMKQSVILNLSIILVGSNMHSHCSLNFFSGSEVMLVLFGVILYFIKHIQLILLIPTPSPPKWGDGGGGVSTSF